MNADGDLAGAQFRGGLLIRQPGHHGGQQFLIAERFGEELNCTGFQWLCNREFASSAVTGL